MANILDVSALNRYVQSLLQEDIHLQDIAIRGEIGNYNKHHKTGHCYFTLSDAKAGIRAVMFRTEATRLSFRPQNGMTVVARGRISLYERDGTYQIYVDALFQEGIGTQKISLDALKEKLKREGLFEPMHKKPLPYNAWTVGVITSKSGAALQDILQVAQRRNPCARVVLAPVSVQGDAAAIQVTSALKKMDACRVDVIIIARGGGSSEDLAVFHDEELARTVFDAKTPIISAIGHEVDFTILDFVADMRAPTPSAAAELAFANLTELLKKEEAKCKNQGIYIHNQLHLCYNKTRNISQALALQAPGKKIQSREIQLQHLRFEMQQHVHEVVSKFELMFRESAQLAAGLSPYAILSRGYTVAKKDGNVVDSVLNLQSGDIMEIVFHDGIVHAKAIKITSQSEVLHHE